MLDFSVKASRVSIENCFLASLFQAAVRAADPMAGILQNLPERPTGRTIVIGAGKGAAQMARALEKVWDGGPLSGLVATRYGYGCEIENIDVVEAGHPVPDASGLKVAQHLLNTVSGLTHEDLVIALICGGGSALLPAPPNGLTLADEINLNEVLLASGAPISAMNVVRKHVSRIKGGRLAAATQARVVSMLVSDIPGDDAAAIASGPTIPDASVRRDALDIVSQYRLELPAAVLRHLNSSAADAPLPSDPVFREHEHHIIASARVSLEAAAEFALHHGVTPVILSDAIEGEARDVALVHAAIAREVRLRNRPFEKPTVLLSGGETTVTQRGKCGRGGRNGEFALAMALAIEGHDIHVLSADTDGIDGSEDNAGAFANGATSYRLRQAGLNGRKLLEQNDSFGAFSAIDQLFNTGPTGTNVNDFRAIYIK